MIYLVVLSALYALHLLLKLHWITTVVIGGFLLLRISGHRKWYKKKIVYERKFEEVSEYLDMLLYAFVKEEKVERALVNVDAAMVDGPMRGVLQKAIDHMHMTFDETDVMRDSLQMIEREYACSRIKNVHDFIVHVEIYGGAIERPVELLLADKKRWEQRICGSMKERRKMFVDIVMSIAASLLICGMILYLPVMEIDISKNLISQVLTIVVVILDDLIFTRAQKYLAIDWLALGNTEHSVFIPFFSGITDTAPAYHLDGDTYNPDGAFWKFKSICTIAEQNRSLYSQGVKDFWKLQEELMYQEMLDAAPAMLAKYSESRAAGDAYVTQLGIDMAEREMLLADNLYAKLLTTMMHNTGLSSSKTPTTFLSDVPLRQVAESRGYTVTWNKADGSTTIAKGDVTYTFTPESYECVTGTGETIELTHYCYVRDGFTYIPMDFAKTL